MDEKAIYNIGAIARLTGIPIATLHAWERRYQFPDAARTPGGHRLYSEKDIALLRCVKEQIEQGVTARQAVAAVQKMDQEGNLPSGHYTQPTPTGNPSASPLALRDQLTTSLLRHDLESADRVMGEMLAFYPPEELTLNVIGPVLNKIGEGWEQGHVSVATEHLASNYLRHRLLMWMVTGPRPRDVNPIVLACVPQEYHEGSLLMLGVLLRRQGWPVAYLGQNVPFADLSTFVKETNPSAVVLVAMREETARELAEWPKWIEQNAGRPPVAFGGRVFVTQPELQETIPGIYLGPTIMNGMNELIRLLQ
jgi:MerR family transcriptional regulator, light-induced transcriptional regulator